MGQSQRRTVTGQDTGQHRGTQPFSRREPGRPTPTAPVPQGPHRPRGSYRHRDKSSQGVHVSPSPPNLRLKLFKGHQARLALFSFFSEGAGGGVATNMNNGNIGTVSPPGAAVGVTFQV